MDSKKWASSKRLLNMTRFEKEPNRMSRSEKCQNKTSMVWLNNKWDIAKEIINWKIDLTKSHKMKHRGRKMDIWQRLIKME